jgi:hypothetical protein
MVPSVQPTNSGEPNASILVRQGSHDDGVRQALLYIKVDGGRVTEAVEAAVRAHPDIAFTVLKDTENDFA